MLKSTRRTPYAEFFDGAKAASPILLGVIPFGMIYGALAISAGLPAVMTQAMSAIVFGGSAQFIATQLIAQGAPYLVIFVTGAIVNLRHMLYSASLAPHLRHLRFAWKVVLAYLLTDEAYAVAITRYTQPDRGGQHGHWYFLGAGLALWMVWQISTAAGIFLGALIPSSWSLDFALPLTFIAIVVPALKDKASIIASIVAGVMAVAAFNAPLQSGLIIATIAGIIAGLIFESLLQPDAVTQHE